MRLPLSVLLLLAVGSGAQDASSDALCDYRLSQDLRDIKNAISEGNRCRDVNRGGIFGQHTEQVLLAMRQHGETVGSLLSQTESLKVAIGAVAEVQASQKAQLASLQNEMETERIARMQQRRTIQEIQVSLNRLKEESKAWVDYLNTMETEMKSEIKVSEATMQETATEVKAAVERVTNLGNVIRGVQGSLQNLERTVTRHTKNLMNIRKNRAREQVVEEDAPTPETVQVLPENYDCPHPYTKVGHGCFTVHSAVRQTWEQARDQCKEMDGDLANPYDLHDLALFLDESFRDTVHSNPGRWGFWIGATLDDSDTWTWVSGVPVAMQVDFWGRGEPGETTDTDERCMFLHSLWRFRAGSDSCNHKKFFICERKVV